jgi:hypothetical protein
LAWGLQLGKGVLRRPVHSDEEVQFALFGAHLGDGEVQVADRIMLKGLLLRLVTGDFGQPAECRGAGSSDAGPNE